MPARATPFRQSLSALFKKNLADARFFLLRLTDQWALTTTHIGPCPTA